MEAHAYTRAHCGAGLPSRLNPGAGVPGREPSRSWGETGKCMLKCSYGVSMSPVTVLRLLIFAALLSFSMQQGRVGRHVCFCFITKDQEAQRYLASVDLDRAGQWIWMAHEFWGLTSSLSTTWMKRGRAKPTCASSVMATLYSELLNSGALSLMSMTRILKVVVTVASDGVRSSFSSVPCRQRTITPGMKAATVSVLDTVC